MKWVAEWGEKEAQLIEFQSQGIDTPALDRKPEYPILFHYYMTAFSTLNQTRLRNFEGNPLPFQLSEIKAFLDLFNVEPDVEHFVRVMTRLDSEYLKMIK